MAPEEGRPAPSFVCDVRLRRSACTDLVVDVGLWDERVLMKLAGQVTQTGRSFSPEQVFFTFLPLNLWRIDEAADRTEFLAV